MKRKPNIATVAERAGVAVSTVSRYLNDRYVSQKARARIARVIQLLDYTRSSTARNLSLGRHGCIGVVVDSSQDPWFTRLLAGIETELSTRDSSLMLASTELTGTYDPGIVFEWIRERRVDGLIIAKSQRRDRVLIRRAVDAQLPTVLVAPDEAFHQVQLVRCDNRGAGVVVANYLVQLGHTRIAFAGGPRPMRELGSAACRRLFEAIDSPGRLQTIEFPMLLTVRESTAAAPDRVRAIAGSAS